MAKCGCRSQRDVIFVAMDALVERIHVEDLIVKRNVTAMSHPCVVDLNCRNSIKPRPDRSHVSELRLEEVGDLTFLDHGSYLSHEQERGWHMSHHPVKWKPINWRPDRWILDCLGWCYYKLHSVSM